MAADAFATGLIYVDSNNMNDSGDHEHAQKRNMDDVPEREQLLVGGKLRRLLRGAQGCVD